jgi:hypothetical protein
MHPIFLFHANVSPTVINTKHLLPTPFGEKKFGRYIKNEAKEREIKKTNFTNIKLSS